MPYVIKATTALKNRGRRVGTEKIVAPVKTTSQQAMITESSRILDIVKSILAQAIGTKNDMEEMASTVLDSTELIINGIESLVKQQQKTVAPKTKQKWKFKVNRDNDGNMTEIIAEEI